MLWCSVTIKQRALLHKCGLKLSVARRFILSASLTSDSIFKSHYLVVSLSKFTEAWCVGIWLPFMHQSASGQGCKFLNLVTGVRIPSGVQNYLIMGYIGIIILSSFILGWMIAQCFRTFENEEPISYKVIGIISIVLMSFVLIFFCVGLREEIRYNALEDYFNGKIEVIEDQQTVRTYKFN